MLLEIKKTVYTIILSFSKSNSELHNEVNTKKLGKYHNFSMGELRFTVLTGIEPNRF